MSSIALSSPVSSPVRATGRGRFARVGLATILAATLANVVVYFLGSALIAYDPLFLPLANVSGAIFFTLPAALVAVLVYAVLLRFAARPVRTFTMVSAGVFVVTLMPDLTYIPTVAGVTVGQTAVLVVMHVVAAAVIVRMLTTLARPQAR